MSEDVDWNRLAKYLFDECTEEEAAQVREWLDRDPKRRSLLRQFRRVLAEDDAMSDRWDTEALWDRVQNHTQPTPNDAPPSSASARPDPAPERPRTRPRSERRPGTRILGRPAVWTGALVVLVTIVGVLWGRSFLTTTGSQSASTPKAQTFTTEEGERAAVRLGDGTQVHLNVESRLTVLPDFGTKSRTVELKGEAFFEVASDSTRPFRVRADGAVTQVLGTAFNVSAYPDDEEATVLVTEGRVSIHAGEGRTQAAASVQMREEGVVLTPRQMARLRRSGDQVIHRDLDLAPHLSWLDGKLTFNHDSFEHVIRSLERWYGLEVSVAEGTVRPRGHLNAEFAEDRELNEVLNVVATAFRLTYRRTGKRVVFSAP